MVENVLHGAAVGQVALPHFPVSLLPPLALVRVQQEDELLLNQLPLLGVGGGGRCARSCPHSAESDLGSSNCSSTDGHTSDRSGLLLRSLKKERSFKENAIRRH